MSIRSVISTKLLFLYRELERVLFSFKGGFKKLVPNAHFVLIMRSYHRVDQLHALCKSMQKLIKHEFVKTKV